MGSGDSFTVVAVGARSQRYGNRFKPVSEGNIAGVSNFLNRLPRLGALNVEKGFAEAARLATSVENPVIVHLGSGIPILGERNTVALLNELPDCPYVGVGIGSRWNRPLMKAAAGKTGGYFTQMNPDEPARWRAFDLLSTLNAPRLVNLEVSAPNTGFVFHSFQSTLAQGEELCAIAKLPAGSPAPSQIALHGLVAGKEWHKVVDVSNPEPAGRYLADLWARLEIDRLLAYGGGRNQIIRVSLTHQILSPFTSFLTTPDTLRVIAGQKRRMSKHLDELKELQEVVEGVELAEPAEGTVGERILKTEKPEPLAMAPAEEPPTTGSSGRNGIAPSASVPSRPAKPAKPSAPPSSTSDVEIAGAVGSDPEGAGSAVSGGGHAVPERYTRDKMDVAKPAEKKGKPGERIRSGEGSSVQPASEEETNADPELAAADPSASPLPDSPITGDDEGRHSGGDLAAIRRQREIEKLREEATKAEPDRADQLVLGAPLTVPETSETASAKPNVAIPPLDGASEAVELRTVEENDEWEAPAKLPLSPEAEHESPVGYGFLGFDSSFLGRTLSDRGVNNKDTKDDRVLSELSVNGFAGWGGISSNSAVPPREFDIKDVTRSRSVIADSKLDPEKLFYQRPVANFRTDVESRLSRSTAENASDAAWNVASPPADKLGKGALAKGQLTPERGATESKSQVGDRDGGEPSDLERPGK